MSDKITILISQGEQIKTTKPEIWLPQFDEDLKNLRKIYNTYLIDPNDADNQFRKMIISQYSSFGEYVKSQNINAVKYKFAATLKESKRKKKCLNCGCTDFEYNGDTYTCTKCGSTIIKKQGSQLVDKAGIDESKHILKQLNAISGKLQTPPANINKILPYVKMWFLNRSYLYNWLIYDGRLDEFKKKYEAISGIKIDDNYFKEEIKPGVENLCKYNIFKLYTDEFYTLTARIKDYMQYTSNMSILTEGQQFEICKMFYEINHRLPSDGETFKLVVNDGINQSIRDYEIGKYIIRKRITDINSKTEIKQCLNNLFGFDITLPGLMFEYELLCGSRGQIPMKFNYQQNYIFIVKDIYKLQLVNILEADKQDIINIMLKFNKFIKDTKKIETGKKHNSCLWQVILKFILEMPYFRCYSDIIKILPIKSYQTVAHIKEYWLTYKIINYKDLAKYENILRDKCVDTVKTITTTKNESVNVGAVLDAINQIGTEFGRYEEDKFFSDKLFINNDDDFENFDLDKINQINENIDKVDDENEDEDENDENEYYQIEESKQNNYELNFEDDSGEDENVDDSDYDDY